MRECPTLLLLHYTLHMLNGQTPVWRVSFNMDSWSEGMSYIIILALHTTHAERTDSCVES